MFCSNVERFTLGKNPAYSPESSQPKKSCIRVEDWNDPKKMGAELRKQKYIWSEYTNSGGSGKTGQVKAASFGSRSITLLGQNLNRDSVIDFINSVIDQNDHQMSQISEKLSKGFFLFGGASNEVIEKTFDEIIKLVAEDKSLLENLGGKESKNPADYYTYGAGMPGVGRS